MSVSDPGKQTQKEPLEELNETIRKMEENHSNPPVLKGSLIPPDSPHKSPIGLILLADPKNPKPIRALIKKISGTDFKLTLPFKLSKILYRLSFLNREVKRLKKQVMVDEMTDMYNFRFFRKQLKTEIARSARTGSPCSLIIFDIDYFKRINDTHGHLVGDRVLKETAKRILRSIRVIDYAVRYGGEEFAVILPSTGLVEAISIAERIRRAISDHPFRFSGCSPISLTMSGGVAEFSDLFYTTMGTLIEAADKALYQAKNQGRNRIGYFKKDLEKITEVGVRPEERKFLLKSEDEEAADSPHK